MMRLGRKGISETISRHCALAQDLGQRVAEADDLELTAPVSLSIVCFRYRPAAPGLPDADIDTLNLGIVDEVNARGRVFMSPTVIVGSPSLRACIIHYDVRPEDIDLLVFEIRSVGRALTSEA